GALRARRSRVLSRARHRVRALPIELALQRLDVVEQANEPRAERCQRILDAWRDLRVRRAHQDAVAYELAQSLVKHLRRKAGKAVLERARAAYALTHAGQH